MIKRAGVVVYPHRIPRNGKVVVGVWIPWHVSSRLRDWLMQLNDTAGWGHIGVDNFSSMNRTIIKYIGPAAKVETANDLTPRQIAVLLARAVWFVLFVRPIYTKLRNVWQVSRALA